MIGESPIGSVPIGSKSETQSAIQFPETIAIVSVNILAWDYTVHLIQYATDHHRLHTSLYDSISTAITDSSAYHVVSYEVSGAGTLTADYRFHTISYAVTGADPISRATSYHEINYTVIGVDSLTSASVLHTVLYEGSAISSFVSDQRLHEISYAVIGTNPITSSSSFHQVFYTVFTPSIKFNEIFYKSVILNNRLHLSGWMVDTSQYRIHESRYHVVDTSTTTEIGTITFRDSNSNTYDFLALTITADEDSPYWQCEVSLKDAQNYILFQRDTPFIISSLCQSTCHQDHEDLGNANTCFYYRYRTDWIGNMESGGLADSSLSVSSRSCSSTGYCASDRRSSWWID